MAKVRKLFKKIEFISLHSLANNENQSLAEGKM